MKILLTIFIIQIILIFTNGYFRIGNKWFEYDWSAERYWTNMRKMFRWIKNKIIR